MCGQMQYHLPDTFEVEPPVRSAWKSPEPVIENADEKKALFGIELAKYPAFKAATEVFGEDTSTAVWVSQNWTNDPIVVAAKDKYLEAADTSQALLDKAQLSRKLLAMAEEKNQSNTFYLLDGKDRLKALELYAKINGHLNDKLDASSVTNLIHNQMTIKLVSAEKEKIKTIDDESQAQNINLNNTSPIKLKLVG